MPGEREVRIRARNFIQHINKTYAGGIVEIGGKFKALKVARFSSGILALDTALGGGWPFNRVVIIAGEYSTGKTLLAMKAAAEIENYDHITKRHRDFCDERTFTPGIALVVDAEGSYDREWASINGVNEDLHAVARPEHAEQVVDIVTTAINENIFDLIIVDSIAAMAPSKELEESAEDWQMGLAARINNKAFRKWNSQLNKLNQSGVTGPIVICINQFRLKIGLQFGDPRVLPGGKGQGFSSSIIIYMKGAKYDDTDSKELVVGSYKGVVYKNKTYIPKQNFAFEMGLKDTPDIKKGAVLNGKFLMDRLKALRLLQKVKEGYKFGDKTFRTQAEVVNLLGASEGFHRKAWRSVVKAATDQLV